MDMLSIMSRRANPIVLSAQERSIWDTWGRGRILPVRLVQRAQIIRMAADGVLSQDIARNLGVSRPTVQLWRQRFLALRLPGLEKDAPRPGRIPRIAPRKIKALVEATLHTKPANATHWSTRTMAKAQGASEAPVPAPAAARSSDEERALRDDDTRLQTQRHNDLVCGAEHARRQGDRRLYAP